MELKECIQIIKKDMKLFMAILILIVLSVFAYFSLKPVSYATSLTFEITRSGSQATQDYKFDDFYRLQADERFGETLVQWLKSPAIASEIYQNAGISYSNIDLIKLSGLFKAEKRSSQIVFVSFSSKSIEDSQKISKALMQALEKNTEKLNKDQKQENWFKIETQNPITIRNENYSLMYFLASILAGIFIGFWVVMIRHYLR